MCWMTSHWASSPYILRLPAPCFCGEVAEWSNAAVLKTVVPRDRDRGFESHPLLKSQPHKIQLGSITNTAGLLGTNFIMSGTSFLTQITSPSCSVIGKNRFANLSFKSAFSLQKNKR